MKRFALSVVVLLSLIGTFGCMNINQISNSEVDKPASVLTKNVTEDNQNEDLNANINVETESETSNKTDSDENGISSFIPDGWHILEKYDGKLAKIEGDLNKDGISDIAVVIEDKAKTERPLGPPRSLLIAFGDSDNTYSLSIKADNAIMRGDEGGGFGDPFDDLVINRGSILLKFFGGSSRWHKYYRFRYQNDGWYLIGYTEGSYESIGDEMVVVEEDYNLLTGDYIIEEVEDGKVKTIKSNRGKRQLLNLQDFDVEVDNKSKF